MGKKKKMRISVRVSWPLTLDPLLCGTQLPAAGQQRFQAGCTISSPRVPRNWRRRSNVCPNTVQSARDGPGSEAERLPPSRLERDAQVPDAGTVGLQVVLAEAGCGAILDGRTIGKK